MLVEITVAHDGHKVGDQIDLPDSDAVRMICGRRAIPASPKVERAVAEPVAKETRKRKK